jgi:hypothetical protein
MLEIEWERENGEVIARYTGPIIGLDVYSTFSAGASCLKFVDPCGDTIFNQAQIRAVIEELDALLDEPQGPATKRALFAVHKFVSSALGRSNTFVRFIGL